MSSITKGYETLTGPERFVLLIEAMARKDEVECDRLEDTCPQLVYRCEDVEFRDRVRRAYHVAATVCLNMREGMAQIRMAEAIRLTATQFIDTPTRVAEVAFLYGREYGKWEAGAIDQIKMPNQASIQADISKDADLRKQLGDLREIVAHSVDLLATSVHESVGRVHAVELLSHWEGFSRFCRDTLGLDALTLVRAYGLQQRDLATEVLRAYPDARLDEAEATRIAEQCRSSWARRFT